MKTKMLDYLCCAVCRSPLTTEDRANDVSHSEIQDGYLCCLKCESRYIIRNSIPRFVDEKNYADTFGFEWNKHARAQIDKFNGFSFSKERFYAVTGWSDDLRGQLILEAGSGAGRFTQVACKTGAEVISFDYSSAVEANWKNNKEYENLHIFQGDIYHIPLRQGLFDKVFCFGVLQHTPNVKDAFMSLVPYVKPSGELVIDIYNKRIRSMLSWKYLLRPLTKRMDKEFLYNIIVRTNPILLPCANLLRKYLGKLGGKIMPIVSYAHLGLPAELNREWSILDTFDMYSPAYDHPQSKKTVKSWFREAGFKNVRISNGPNGLNAKGLKPEDFSQDVP